MSKRGASWARLGILVLGLLAAGYADADVFRFEDAAGVVHYTNVPSDARYHPVPGWSDPPVFPARALPFFRSLARYVEAIHAAAKRHGIDPRLVETVIVVESGGNTYAVSPKGAMGLMQLMPHRAVELGVRNPFDPLQNLEGGVRHLRDLLHRFAGDVTLALAAYNAGEEAVRAFRGVPPYRETQDYVRKIRTLYPSAGGGLAETPATASPEPGAVYQQIAEDGSTVYTNVPPAPAHFLLRSRF